MKYGEETTDTAMYKPGEVVITGINVLVHFFSNLSLCHRHSFGRNACLAKGIPSGEPLVENDLMRLAGSPEYGTRGSGMRYEPEVRNEDNEYILWQKSAKPVHYI